MEFELTTSGYYYKNEKKIKELEEIGFTFTQNKFKSFTISGDPIVEIKDLDELIQFANKWGGIIIHNKNIEIYDDYLE